jgi:sec-independent protein translocase protein TatA
MSTLLFMPVLGIIGPTQLIIIVVLVIIFFGAKKIPELMRGAGRGIKEFKDAMNKDYSQDDDAKKPDQIERQ